MSRTVTRVRYIYSILMYMNCLEREGIRILKLFLSILTPNFGICNRVAKCDRIHYSRTKSHLPTWIKTNTAISLLKLLHFLYKKHLVLVSNCVCLQKKTRWPPSQICRWSNPKQCRFYSCSIFSLVQLAVYEISVKDFPALKHVLYFVF